MNKGKAIQNILLVEKLKEKLADTSKEAYYLFITGFNTGLKLKELLSLTKEDLIKLKKDKADDIIEPDFWEEIEAYIKDFEDKDPLFTGQNAATLNHEEIYRLIIDAASDLGIEGFGDETLSRTYGYFHYQKFRDIERLQKMFGLVSPTATLHYIGYEDDRYLCFHCNIGCLWSKK
jgi:integrase